MEIKELIERGFINKMYEDMGEVLYKDYSGANFHYSIIVSLNGNVFITNYDKKNSGTFCLNFSKEFTDDLLFIIPHVNGN